jgi:hypothetical protein
VSNDGINANWPKLPNGTVDWKTVFEHPETGMIRLLEAARKPETLIDCTAMIIQALFTRDSDEDLRSKYIQKLATVATSDMGNFSAISAKTTEILHGIKNDRIEGAAKWAAQKAETEPDKEKSGEERKQRLSQTLDDIEIIFADVFCDAFNHKFQVMWGGVAPEPVDGRKLPFTVSSDFARVYEDVVREKFAPWIMARCRQMITDTKAKETGEYKSYLEGRINDPGAHNELWNLWKAMWSQFMEEEEYPEKPEEEEGGLFGAIKRTVKEAMSEHDEYSMEDWQDDAELIDRKNRGVQENVTRLLAPSEIYNAPRREDLLRLRNIFAIIPEDLRKEISAIRQIALEEETAPRVFESYVKGKDLELSLIAASFQNPDLFLRGDKMLVRLLRGQKDYELKKSMPFLARELGDLF